MLLEHTRTRVRAWSPRERRLSHVPQGYGLFPHFTVEQNLTFALGQRDPRALDVAQERASKGPSSALGLSPLLGRRPAGLSGE